MEIGGGKDGSDSVDVSNVKKAGTHYRFYLGLKMEAQVKSVVRTCFL